MAVLASLASANKHVNRKAERAHNGQSASTLLALLQISVGQADLVTPTLVAELALVRAGTMAK